MSATKSIGNLSWLYKRQGLCIVAGLFLMGLLAENIAQYDTLLTPLIVCSIYGLVLETVEGTVWGIVARRSPDSLTTFFMGVSGCRVLTALLMMVIYYLIAGRSAMLVFILTFAVFYIAIVSHHVLFFSRHSSLNITSKDTKK